LNLFSAWRGLLNAILDFCRHYDPPADTRPRNDEGNLKLVMPRLPYALAPPSMPNVQKPFRSVPFRDVDSGENPRKAPSSTCLHCLTVEKIRLRIFQRMNPHEVPRKLIFAGRTTRILMCDDDDDTFKLPYNERFTRYIRWHVSHMLVYKWLYAASITAVIHASDVGHCQVGCQ